MEGQTSHRRDDAKPPAILGDLIWCFADESAEKAAELMEENQIRRLPILDRDMHLCGILSLRDLAGRRHVTSGEVLKEVGKFPPMHA